MLRSFPLQQNFFGFVSRKVRDIEGKRASEQFIQNHPQRVNVALYACALSTDLFRRGVGWSHHAQPRQCWVRGWFETLNLLGDSEIQEAHAAVAFHENVGRLQVTMYDSLPVGILHGLANRTEQLKATINGAHIL